MSVQTHQPFSQGTTERKLRIAMIAPPWFSVPPRGYGGIESMVADLVDGLVGRGHHVTLIGAGRAGTQAQRFVPIYVEPPSTRLGDPLPEVLHVAAAASVLADLDVDVVHDHTLAGPLLARRRPEPTVMTAHGPVVGEPGDYLAHLGSTVEVVAISEAQRRQRPEVNWIATVHNSVDVSSFPFGRGDAGYVLFLGRFNPEKAPHLAIDAARAAGRRIVLAGKLNEPPERQYFEQEIRPRLGPGVEYVGEADATTKRELYAGAEALLFPACWEEPFGLVMIEAMACGTPVVALRRGSVPEIVHHGLTGFVLDRPEQMAAAIEVVGELDRAECRAHVERHFDSPGMVRGYEAVYHTLVSGREILSAGGIEQTGDEDLVTA
jgi:glycosyltransferase involved in cell wall biosynthesis